MKFVTGAVEVRASGDGPKLNAVLLQEGRAASGGRREVFAPGSVEWPETGVGVLLAHRVQPPEVRAVPVRDARGRLTIEAPATDAIQNAVSAGRRYMSVEFHALEERTTKGGVREVLRAYVPDAALVASPEYDTTMAEVRQRATLYGSVQKNAPVDCRCAGPNCRSARIISVELTTDDVLGYLGDYSKPLGPARMTERSGRIETEIDIEADTTYAQDLLANIEAGVAPIIRPYPDPMRSESRKEGETLVYDKLAAAGFIATFTDQARGFAAARLAAEPEERRERRRLWL